MVPVLLLMQAAAVVELVPPRPIYDVDVLLVQGRDTIPLPPVRLSEGLEGQVILAVVGGAPLLYRTLVRQEESSTCLMLMVALGEVGDSTAKSAILPSVVGRVCGVESQALGGAGELPVVLARVRRVMRADGTF